MAEACREVMYAVGSDGWDYWWYGRWSVLLMIVQSLRIGAAPTTVVLLELLIEVRSLDAMSFGVSLDVWL
jgi:hypothetical protein